MKRSGNSICNREWIDISVPVSEASVVWPGAPKTELTLRRSMQRGDRSNNSNLFMNCHTGTHIDAPLHFVKNGASIDQVPLDALMGEVYLLDCSQQLVLDVRNFEALWPKEDVKRVLLKTSNSKLWEEGHKEFIKDYCALTEETARWLLSKKVSLIGIDYLSIQRFGDSPIVHQLLLEAGVVIVEGLDLSNVDKGMYQLICLPIKLAGLEAAPARVILSSLQS